MWRDACRELQFDANTSVGGRLKLLLPQVTADGLCTDRQTHDWAWECVRNAVPCISSHLITYDVSYHICQQFENVRSVAQSGMESI
jgi:hypothetical protein